MTNLISLNNGLTFITASEALEQVSFRDIMDGIDTNSDACLIADARFGGDTDLEWLELFLSIHGNLIIG
jgi:hypothetical protein